MPLDIPDDLQKAAAAKSINDQINQYIVVMDTKASAFLAGNVAVASFYLSTMPQSDGGRLAYYLALALFGAAILMAGGVIMAVPMFIMFFLFQRYFLQGVTFGALKG